MDRGTRLRKAKRPRHLRHVLGQQHEHKRSAWEWMLSVLLRVLGRSSA